MAKDQRFPKREHLRKRADFDGVFARKTTAADDVLVVHVARNGLSWSRLGISVAKRLGNAAQRNYVRRRIREAWRTRDARRTCRDGETTQADLPDGYDIVCIARPRAMDGNCDVARSLWKLIAKAVRRSRDAGKESHVRPQRTADSGSQGR